jgi:hypothetical protein
VYLTPVASVVVGITLRVLPFIVYLVETAVLPFLSSIHGDRDFIVVLNLIVIVWLFVIIVLLTGSAVITLGLVWTVVPFGTVAAADVLTFKISANPNKSSTDNNNFRLILSPPYLTYINMFSY